MWIFLIIFAVLLLCLALDQRLLLRHYQIPMRGIERPFRIVLLADHHSSRYGRAQERLLALIAKEKPDLILMAGDMVDDKRPTEETERLFEGPFPCPVYYVAGNHERRRSDWAAVKEKAEESGLILLSDELRVATIAGQRLLIGGMEDPENRKKNPVHDPKAVLAEAFFPVRKDPACRILLAHKPEHISDYAQYGFDLVVSGHAHGGQVRLPGLPNGLFAPGQGFFPRLTGGVYPHGETIQVVSRGLLRAVFPPKLFNRPEVVVIDLIEK